MNSNNDCWCEYCLTKEEIKLLNELKYDLELCAREYRTEDAIYLLNLNKNLILKLTKNRKLFLYYLYRPYEYCIDNFNSIYEMELEKITGIDNVLFLENE